MNATKNIILLYLQIYKQLFLQLLTNAYCQSYKKVT